VGFCILGKWLSGRVKKMTKKNIAGIAHTEWHYLLISILFLVLPVVTIIPTGFSTWMMRFIVLFLLVVWFAFVVYILLFSTKFTMEQEREIELVKSIEKYFIKVLEDVEWTDDTVNMVIDALYDWTRLSKEEKHERY
jgi:hypothetical protein